MSRLAFAIDRQVRERGGVNPKHMILGRGSRSARRTLMPVPTEQEPDQPDTPGRGINILWATHNHRRRQGELR